MKIISFSLFGNNPIYTIGAIKNAELAKLLFPDWVVWVYHDNSVEEQILQELTKLDVKLILEENRNMLNTLWRFKPLYDDGVTLFISRDTDSRLNERDVISVSEWLTSGFNFHIIRDHPIGHSWRMNAGMWGGKSNSLPEFESIYHDFINNNRDNNIKTLDQIFLQNHIYNKIVSNSLIHDEYFKYESNVTFIKHDRASNDFAFIGESLDENDIPRGDQRIPIKKKYYE